MSDFISLYINGMPYLRIGISLLDSVFSTQTNLSNSLQGTVHSNVTVSLDKITF